MTDYLHVVLHLGSLLLLICKSRVIPSTPLIKEIVFAKDTLYPSIHWQTSDNMELLNSDLRFRITHGVSDWMKGNVTQLHQGNLLMLENLEPLTSYEFKLRVCTTTLRLNCSLWSQPVNKTSPRKAPLSKLDVWRIIRRNEGNYTQNVRVLWKAFTSEDHDGELQYYELIYQQNGSTHTLNFSVLVTQCSLQLPLEVTGLNVSAVTSAGSSPPASVSLIYTGRPAPMIYLSRAAGGRILLDWNTSHPSYSNTSEEMLGFVVQWECSKLKVQWKRIRRDQNSTFIDGAAPCTLYNISLYVESSEGVSDPTFGQIDFKGENVDDLPKSILHQEMSISRLASAGHKGHKDEMVIGISLITAVPLIIIVNLVYLKCARQRIRKVCMSMGPSWLFEHLPKLGDSNAIKLLKDESCGSDLCWQQVESDPPLSPVEDFNPPVERKDSYPTAHTENPLEEMKAVQDWAVCPYKPQLAVVSQRLVAVSEAVEKEEDEHAWVSSSPAFTQFEEVFFPSQGMHRPLNSCLTVDGAPISVDVDGLLFLSQISIQENMWRVQRDATLADNVNGDQNTDQGQAVLPNDLMRCERANLNTRCLSPQGVKTVLKSSDEQFE
ncbi:interleukin-23 receptor isoform X2 [Electrophorus electricus]|uniref:interleukin-23 receptor isoform X2 n=1 Tax=Electrophorus electricus TaxID=8005 RepID=UPI0015D044B8|nr:interleukin-23 receptor isoform X2 [Electrophorus electricus]